MHDTTVKLKDGTTWCGPMWEFKPVDGYLTLVIDDPSAPERLYFRDMTSAITEGQRVGTLSHDNVKIEDQDELARARPNGWNGK